jgi:phosphotransferase system  glucose/maltose/N-acetylglucosamine-specific IIC component
MFSSDFKYLWLLMQQDRDGDLIPVIDKNIVADIWICGINALAIGAIGIITYNVFPYASAISGYILTELWNSLTTGQHSMELAVIATSIICALVMFMAFGGITNIIDKIFEKLKDEINKKDEKIRQLEAKLNEQEAKMRNSAGKIEC